MSDKSAASSPLGKYPPERTTEWSWLTQAFGTQDLMCRTTTLGSICINTSWSQFSIPPKDCSCSRMWFRCSWLHSINYRLFAPPITYKPCVFLSAHVLSPFSIACKLLVKQRLGCYSSMIHSRNPIHIFIFHTMETHNCIFYSYCERMAEVKMSSYIRWRQNLKYNFFYHSIPWWNYCSTPDAELSQHLLSKRHSTLVLCLLVHKQQEALGFKVIAWNT